MNDVGRHFPSFSPSPIGRLTFDVMTTLDLGVTRTPPIPPISGHSHRRFLAGCAGRAPGSWARGADFQVNEETEAIGAPMAPSPRSPGWKLAR
jgi:hypothetical protein